LGYGLWRHRIALVGSAILVGALATFQISAAGPGVADSGSDCADTTMSALTRGTEEAARAAYACLDPSLRSGQGEDAFVRAVQQRSSAGGKTHATRVADHASADGGRMVFYTVDGGHESVGYIVYLTSAGRVARID
jgi:uncharacterized protein (UPF0548 family)